jgi:hypothetical protein
VKAIGSVARTMPKLGGLKRVGATAAIALVMILTLTVGAASGGVKNGNFKRGDFSKWKTSTDGGQIWRLYDRGRNYMPPFEGAPIPWFDILPDPLSRYSPVIDQFANAGTSSLYRKIKLPKRARKLTLWFYYFNRAGEFEFGADWSDPTNQFLSIDVLRRKAPADTSNPGDVIHNLFAPDEGPVDPPPAAASPQANRGWNRAEWRIRKRYRGKRVQLREIVSVFAAGMPTGIDDVRIKKRRRR